MRRLRNVARAPPRLALGLVRQHDGALVRHSCGHQLVFQFQVHDEKCPLVVLGFVIDPEFVRRDIRAAEMLAKIGEFFVQVPADIAAIHNPNVDGAAGLDLS